MRIVIIIFNYLLYVYYLLGIKLIKYLVVINFLIILWSMLY